MRLLACSAAAGLVLLCACSSTGPRPRGVLLLTLDTTRADRLGAWGSSSGATPHLDSLAERGTAFLDATISSPLTRPAHASLLSGVTPLRHGVRDNLGHRLPDELRTLAERLAPEGYRSLAVVAAGVLARDSGLDRGFGRYDDDLRGRPERTADEVAERAIAWLADVGEAPFLAWLHFYDPHLPWEAGPEWDRRFPGDGYAAEIARMDAAVGSVIAALETSGRLDSTLVVAVADHGEGLGEHGEPDHGVFLYQSTLHVPLIVRLPGAAPRRVPALVRDVDVVPTVLEALGLPLTGDLDGRSLLPAIRGADPGTRAAYAESFYARHHYGWSSLRALRDERYKYVESPRPELFDLERDPGETRNLADQQEQRAAAMAARLASLAASESGSASGRSAPDREALERLRALGYVGAALPDTAVDDGPSPRDRVASLALFAEVVPPTLACLARRDCDASHVAALERVIEVEPRYVEGHVLRSKVLARLGRTGAAIAAIEEALRLNPEDTASLADLADLRAAAGDLAGGLEALDAARALSPADGDLVSRQARLLRAGGRDGEAEALLRAFLAAHPEEPLARYELGCVLLERGDAAAAEPLIRRAFEAAPGLDKVHYNLALLAEVRGDREAARAHYLDEVAARPDNFEAWTNLGLLELESGAPEAAAEAARRVIELEPRLFAGPWLLARARLAATGRPDAEVRALARRAVELAPGSPAARALLDEVERGQGG